MDFEKSNERLEEIIKLLEQDDVPLDKSIALFSEAVEIVKNCQTIINDSKNKVAELLQVIEDK